jgi:hypothetical protein
MENMTIREFIDQYSVKEKLIAVAAITNTPSLLDRDPNTVTEGEQAEMMKVLCAHILTNGKHGVKMAILAGRAIKSSIEFPIKKKTGIAQRLKDLVKKVLK